jgi:hypothetical protein
MTIGNEREREIEREREREIITTAREEGNSSSSLLESETIVYCFSWV